MSSLGTVLLLQIFPALLPPKNNEDRDFYAVLDLPNGASEADVRKAYKKKSLALHPDKIAQRRASAITAEEAAKEYQLVQEAHACLSTPEGRQKYHAVQCSPTRYRFLTQEGGLGNQTSVVKNLSQASFGDKTRLVLFISLFPALLLVQPILIAVKVNHLLKESGALENARWVAILIPWWIFHGLFILFWMTVAFLAPPQAKIPIVSTVVEQVLWYTSFIILALRWDQTITADYVFVFIPVYLALIMNWLHTVLLMQQISKDMSKMVSKDHFLADILHGKEPEELDEEELKDLHEKYVVVQQIPPDIEHELQHDDDLKYLPNNEKEEIRVSSSREFEAAMEAYNEARRTLVKSMLLDVAFLVLLILKVDRHLSDLSWWVVFAPVLVHYGLRYLQSCFICCCSAGPGMDPDEVVVLAMNKDDLENVTGNNNQNEGNITGDNPNPQNDSDTGAFPLNSTVLLHSLKAQEFNGKTGIVKGPIKDGRQEVYIQELDKTVALKLDNMKHLDNSANKDDVQATTRAKTTTPNTPNDIQEPNVTSKSNATASNEPTGKKKEEEIAATSRSSTTATATTTTPTPSDAIKDDHAKGDHPSLDEPATTSTPAGDGTNDNHDEGEPSIHIDPEAYRAYQSAYAAAEANAMENRVKAGQDNCVTTIKLVMICLLVAKLEQSYEAIEEREKQGEDANVDVGFNTLWLIFPLFLIVGFMISCCACLIYNAPNPDELMHKEDDGDGNDGQGDEEAANNNNGSGVNDQQQGSDTPTVFAPTPPPPEMDVPAPTIATEECKVDEAAADKLKEDTTSHGNQSPADGTDEKADINDLD